ncbi:MAG: hypothetical protein CVU44_19225 [Chloroflexi bacterium HGW-Chloroflexi-6]|nr:MAG: hypothetical protein CVU44_19225 [Chloroflexi bacterium HGW-Chloroflexi-6]
MTTPALAQSSWSSQTLAWIKGFVESTLNWVFSLTHSAALYRNLVRSSAVILLYLYWVLTLYDLNGWARVFGALNEEPISASILFIRFMTLLISIFLHPEVLRHMLALALPYVLIHRLASVYLADIFEKDTEVASRFIKQAAFAQDYLTIRIRAGRLLETNYDSPIVQIGGPGYITVELDSAAVLESPDGSVRVIGPTVGEPRGRAVIDDFERLRQCIDLRDTVDKQDVTSRSKDGIVITARDIQYSYSVYRGPNAKKTLKSPYPFDPAAVQRLVYDGTVIPMWPGKIPEKSAEWARSPSKLFVSVNIEFSNFIGSRGLSEFFSSIGAPEEEALRKREEKLHLDSMALAGREGIDITESPLKAVPFTSRFDMGQQLFGAEKFKDILKNKGFQVNWIGVGTWVLPSEIIPTNHLEAWKTSQDNRRLGGPEQLKRLYEDTRIMTLIKLINEMPILLYYRLYAEMEKGEKREQDIIQAMFDEYVNRLKNAAKHFDDIRESTPENIVTALQIVDALSPYHEIGADYYVCTRVTSRADASIQGAVAYLVEVALAKTRLRGYRSEPIEFDFGEKENVEFVFSLDVSDGTMEPAGPQPRTMKRDGELYTQVEFQIILLSGSEADAWINISHNKISLTQDLPAIRLTA